MNRVLAMPERALGDAELVRAAVAGQTTAEEALYRRHAQRAHRLALRLLGNHHDAEDAVQESFVIVLDRLDSLCEPAAFGGWLRTIVVHSSRRILRRRALLRRLGFVDSMPVDLDALMSDAAPPDLRIRLRGLFDVMASWPADERIAFCLQHLEGLSLEEIAAATGRSRATVNRQLARARTRAGEGEEGFRS
jgi:RNA polymerase sigma-70 factor (ECF subfamily)